MGPQGQCPHSHPRSGGPYQGILVDVGPLNLLGSVPGQDHGSAQHIQVLLQGHRAGESMTWEPDASLLQTGDTPVATHTPGIINGVLGASFQLQAELGWGLGSYQTQGNGSSLEPNGPAEMQTRCCSPLAVPGQGRDSPGSASQSPRAPSHPQGWA